MNPLDVDELTAKPIVVIDFDCRQPLQRTLTSSNGSVLLDEAANQDSSVLSRELNGSRKPRKESQISPDESRLLGAHRQPPDPYAVPIKTPTPSGGKKGMGHLDIPRGFKPTNTLHRSANIRSTSPNNRYTAQDHSNERKRVALDTETSTGDNVAPIQQYPESVIDLDRSPKRPKLRSQSSSENSSDAIISFDPRQSDSYTVTRLRQSQRRSQGKGSQGPSNYSQAPGTGRCSINAEVKEFASVEQTMKNGERPLSKRRQHKSGNHPQSDSSSTAIEMASSSRSLDSDPIQSTLQHKHGTVTRHPYKGTARISLASTTHPKSTSRYWEQPENGGQSRHLNNSPFPQKLLSVHDPQDSSTSKGQGRFHNKSSNLNEILIESHDKWRGELPSYDSSSISSDELASGTIASNNARRQSPPKNLRANSPIKRSSSQKAISASCNATGLEPSNIPASDFISSKRARHTKRLPTQKTTYPGENEAPWSIDLFCVNAAGQAGEPVLGPNLGLVFDDSTKAYKVRKDGSNLTTMNPSLQIQPKKLLKVTCATESRKMRFDFSKTGSHDHVLDIEMCSDKDVRDLLVKLRKDSSSYKVNHLSEGIRMDKIFENRQAKYKTYSGNTYNFGTKLPEDLQLATRNRERRDMAQDELSESGNCKRRREGSEADQEGNKLRLSRGMKRFTRDPKSGIIFDPHDLRSIDQTQEKIRSKPPSPHLRGSRSKSEFEPGSSRRRSPLEDFPRRLRYSVKEGLENQWSKPLLYPKNGMKKISVEWIDLERLDEGEFLNDNLIAFYLRFLQDQLEQKSPELAKKVYFFNTFFFASLTNTQRGKKGINYEAVQKWTRSVNIFSYDYVVVPINESAHWYVAIVCNLPALASIPDMGEDIPKDEPPLSPAGHDDPDGLSTQALGRESSPTASVSIEESRLPVHKTEDPVEQDPTASFAEMTLETASERRSELEEGVGTVQIAVDDPPFDVVGQAMLDMQIRGNMAESTTLGRRGASPGDVELEETKDDVTIVQSHSPKTSSVSRKRKRKSIPPIQRIDPTNPLILTFDSLGLAHPPTIRILKDYLLAEGKAKRGMELDVSRIKGLTAKQIPQQDNMCDCGLFLLGYIDKFLDDPKDFIIKVIGHKYDLEKDWSKLIPSNLRANIRDQIEALYAEQELERQDEKRESAKRANKYHERPLQNSDAGPSSNTNQIESTQSEASEALRQVLMAAARDLSPEQPSTWDIALKTAIPIDEPLARQATDVLVKQSKRSILNHTYQDSSDPLHQEMDIVVRRSPSPLLGGGYSPAVIGSQLDATVNKMATHSEPCSAKNRRSRSDSVELPSTIQDSQPNSFEDLFAAGKFHSKTSPPPSCVETENRRSASRGGRLEHWGDESDKNSKDGSRVKKAAPECEKAEHQPRSSGRHKQTPVREIVELDD